MKTKEQILKWIDEQPWANEFYKTAFLRRINLYNDVRFISCAFIWEGTEQGKDIWEKRDEEFRKWYDDDKPKSWEEYCKQNPIKEDEYYISSSSNICKAGYISSRGNLRKVGVVENQMMRDAYVDVNVMPKDLCKAFVAYMKLIQLRNAWVKGWEASYCSYKIEAKDGVILTSSRDYFMYGLSFPTPEMANEFIKTFKDLLEVAKPLL